MFHVPCCVNRVTVCINWLCYLKVLDWSILAGKIPLRQVFGKNPQNTTLSSLTHITKFFLRRCIIWTAHDYNRWSRSEVIRLNILVRHQHSGEKWGNLWGKTPPNIISQRWKPRNLHILELNHIYWYLICGSSASRWLCTCPRAKW
jgi:hypothetical protein